MVFVHGGGFISGSFLEMDQFCKRWSERGYVTATIEYRLGMVGAPLLDPPYVYDVHEVPRAAWRAVQDIRHGLQYLFRRSAELAIDTTHYLVGGASAGAISVLHHSFLDSRVAMPRSVRAVAEAQRLQERYGRPDLINAIDTLPFPQPCAVVSYFGAMIYPEWLGQGPHPRIFMYHQDGDLVVGCGRQKGLWGVPLPGVSEQWPILTGPCVLENSLRNSMENPDALRVVIHAGLGHEFHDVSEIDSLAAVHCSPCAMASTTVSVDETQTDSNQHWHLFSILGVRVDQGLAPFETIVESVAERHPTGLYVLRTTATTYLVLDGTIVGRR